MVDIEKQISFWREGAREDWTVARELLERGRTRHSLFFAHLALEKALKGLFCRATRDLAPRTHNLVRLAEATQLDLEESQLDVFAEMNAFAIEGRYPETLALPPDASEVRGYWERAEEVFEWLMNQL
jgi:HEPN domain-containing protein